ncbi:hypothetical protein COLO4_24804 [Corchorus olitorius]|uniref:Uncharacterized protein n=1 Tax=Corchorus olitorius TaxID=93759 RepID=A0A1R3I6J2_9ROSI|nr:hypothetical protein COLO4_24804 [Corchorus olitorius]
MAQKRATLGGAKLKKQESHDLIELPLKLIEPNVLITTPLLQPTSEVLASKEAKAYLSGVNSLSYSPNYSPERMVNSEIIQDSAQVTISPSLSPSIFLNDVEMVDIDELLASGQPDGAVADMWKDIDDVYLSNNPRELGTELIPDPSINLAACNVNGSSWGGIITCPAPKCHAFTMPILKNSIFINQVEKRPETMEDPTIIPIDMNSAPSDKNEPNSSIVEAVKFNLPARWNDFHQSNEKKEKYRGQQSTLDSTTSLMKDSVSPCQEQLAIQAEIDDHMAKVKVLRERLVKVINKKELPSLNKCDQVLEEATALISHKEEFSEAGVNQYFLNLTLMR